MECAPRLNQMPPPDSCRFRNQRGRCFVAETLVLPIKTDMSCFRSELCSDLFAPWGLTMDGQVSMMGTKTEEWN